MADPDNPAAEAAERFAEVVRREHEEVAAAINATASPKQALDPVQKAFKAAKDTCEALEELRDMVVGRIWEAEEMTAAAMAERINVTRQRVGQIAKEQRQKEQQP